MKKQLVCIAMSSLIASTAYAGEPLTMDVAGAKFTLYGTLDGGIWVQSKSTSDQGNQTVGPDSAGSVNRFHSGGIAPSKWGIRATKDLGNGITGMMKLEEHITAGTGAIDAFGYPGFARQAYVGATGPFGTVIIGEQFTPALLAYANTDPRGLRESLSGLQPWLLTTNFGNSTSSAVLDAFTHNAISYAVDVAHFHLAAHYGLGGNVGGANRNSNWSAGATFASGPVTVSGGYQVGDGANGSKSSVKSSIGIGFGNGTVAVKANYLSAKLYDPSGNEVANYKIPGVGVDWKITARQLVALAYYSGKNDKVADNKAGTTVLSTEYYFDPSLTFYAQIAAIDAKSRADMGVSLLGNASLVQGATTTVVNVGIAYNF